MFKKKQVMSKKKRRKCDMKSNYEGKAIPILESKLTD